jgi:hypothetical protein
MIGGFDQFRYFTGSTPEETRRAVRACFEQAGAGGGYILSPSDHFFEARYANSRWDVSRTPNLKLVTELLEAFAAEARECKYGG